MVVDEVQAAVRAEIDFIGAAEPPEPVAPSAPRPADQIYEALAAPSTWGTWTWTWRSRTPSAA